MRIARLVAREQFVSLADQKREAAYFDGLKPEVAALGNERQCHELRGAGFGTRTRFNAHAIAQRAAKT